MKNPLSYLHPKKENAVLIYLALLKFIAMLVFAGNYGLFRDEYYYVECSKHFAWGYVDQPPLSIFILFISRTLFGDSLLAIRIFAYISGCVTVFMSGLIAREMGGGRFAQGLAAFAALFSGVILGTGEFFSMNAFDILFSAVLFYYIIKLLNTGNKKLWYIIGAIFGIALMNKLTLLFVGFGLAVGLVLTKHRKYYLTKELWFGAGIAFLIFLPNIIWQITNQFPTLEFMRNASLYKNTKGDPIGFIVGALMELNPTSTILLITALYFLFINKEGKKFILVGILFLTVLIVYILNNGKPYYMGVLYPAILAAGAIGIDYLIQRYLRNWARYVLVIVVLLPGYLFALPYSVPVLDVDGFIKLSEAMGIKPASGERSELGILPQFYADRFGWRGMVEKVAEAYDKLTDEEKKKVLIFGQNYGEAGAVNYYRNEFGLPEAISAHNSFWTWGVPDGYDGSVMIVIGSTMEGNSKYFDDVQIAASHRNKYAMPYENVDIFICRKPKSNLKEAWPKLKHYI